MSLAIGIFLSTEKCIETRVFFSYSNTFDRAAFTYSYTTIHVTQRLQCSPYPAVTGKNYRLKQQF